MKTLIRVNTSEPRTAAACHRYRRQIYRARGMPAAHHRYRTVPYRMRHLDRVHHRYHAGAVRPVFHHDSFHACSSQQAFTQGLIPFTSFFLYFHHPPLHHCTATLQFFNKNNGGWMLAAWLSGLRGYLPNVSLASQSLARMLRLLQAVGPQPSDGRPLASRGSHVAGCHRHFVHRLTTLASVASRARTFIPSQNAKRTYHSCTVYTGCQLITGEQGY